MSSSVGLLPSSLQTSLQKLVERINAAGAGVGVILLSTTEGVPLARVYPSNENDDGNGQAWLDETVLSQIESQPALLNHFALLNMGKEANTVTAQYEQMTLLHVNLTPVVVTILASPTSNIGAIRSAGIPLLKETLEPLCQQLKALFRDSPGHQ